MFDIKMNINEHNEYIKMKYIYTFSYDENVETIEYFILIKIQCSFYTLIFIGYKSDVRFPKLKMSVSTYSVN